MPVPIPVPSLPYNWNKDDEIEELISYRDKIKKAKPIFERPPKSDKKKPRGLVKREAAKFVSWKIANIRDVKSWGVADSGRTVVAIQFKDKTHKLRLNKLEYSVADGKFIPRRNDVSYCLSIKNGQLNIYKYDKNTKKVKNDSLKFELECLKLTKVCHLKRAARVINAFLRQNKFKGRIKFSKEFSDKPLDFEPQNQKEKDNYLLNRYSAEFNRQLIRLIYPGLKEFDNNFKIKPSFSRHLRKGGFKYLLKKCFGHDSKKLTKLVADALKGKTSISRSGGIFELGLVCKGIFNLDNIYKIIEIDPVWSYFKDDVNINMYREFFKLVGSDKVLRWAKKTDKYRNYLWKDTVRMYCSHKDKLTLPSNLKCLNEIHDWYSREINRIQNPNIEFKYSDKLKEIDGAAIGDMKLVLAADSDMLLIWGQQNNNCIFSYKGIAASGNCILMGIYKNEELVYNIEIRNREIVQFSGKYNSSPDKNDKKLVEDFLKEKEIVISPEIRGNLFS